MEIKSAEGSHNVTGQGQGTYNTIAGSLGLASFLGLNANGAGLFSARTTGGTGEYVTKETFELAQKIAAKDSEIALLKSEAKHAEKMVIFGNAEKKMFCKLVDIHPEMAQLWLDSLEVGSWNNYISEAEWEEKSKSLVNQDGSIGPRWSYNQIMSAVNELGGVVEETLAYNTYALALAMNMLWSDHADSATTYVDPANHQAFFYSQAVEKLKDHDRPRFIREYFGL